MSQSKGKKSRPVLVALDFSKCSAEALLWGARTATGMGATLLALHVVHDPVSAPGSYQRGKQAKKHLQRLEESAAEMMDEFIDKLRANHPKLKAFQNLETLLVVGLPVHRILEIADKKDVQQIVVGSRGRTGLPSLLIGSTALQVAQLATVPVTIVKRKSKRS